MDKICIKKTHYYNLKDELSYINFELLLDHISKYEDRDDLTDQEKEDWKILRDVQHKIKDCIKLLE